MLVPYVLSLTHGSHTLIRSKPRAKQSWRKSEQFRLLGRGEGVCVQTNQTLLRVNGGKIDIFLCNELFFTIKPLTCPDMPSPTTYRGRVHRLHMSNIFEMIEIGRRIGSWMVTKFSSHVSQRLRKSPNLPSLLHEGL